jgi:integrase
MATTTIKKVVEQKFNDSEIPDFIRLFSGVSYKPKDEHWKFVDGIYTIYMNFESFPPVMQELVPNIKKVIINYLEINSSSTAASVFMAIMRLAEVIAQTAITPVHQITEAHILNFIVAQKGRPNVQEYHLSAFIGRWAELGLHGVSQNAVKLVKTIKKKPSARGQAVLTMDPVKGPFTDFEVQQLTQAVNLAYAEGRIEPQFFFLTWIAMLTGQRISQYCALKVCDLVATRDESGGISSYNILIPKAKQQGAVLRDEFLSRPLLLQFGEAFYAYAQEVKAANPEMGDQAPMFPSEASTELPQLNADFAGHWTTVSLAFYFRKVLGDIAPICARTSEPMHMAVGRFRDTLGTRAAQEGFGALVIAEILGHVDTQSVKCYIAVIPEVAHRLDKMLAKDLAPLANAFVGKILISRTAATRYGDPSSEIVDYRNSGENVGYCGTTYNCKFNAPVACYVCPKFEAWIDAPHAALYQELEDERKRILESGSERMAAVNDLAMVAIRHVIDECARIKSGLTENTHG